MNLPNKKFPSSQIRIFKGERLKFLGTSFLKDGVTEIVHIQRIDKPGFHETALSLAGWESLPVEPEQPQPHK